MDHRSGAPGGRPQASGGGGAFDAKYARLRVLGKGSFGQAIVVRHRDDGQTYVAKEIDLSTMSPKEREESKNEIAILSKLDHPNIVKLKEYFLTASKLYIVMEYADGGDLDQKIKKAKASGRPMPERQVMNFFVQILLGLKHMHDKKILHRDIKTANIFLTATGLVKLGDFGISTVLRNTMAQANTVCGTPYYFSPELCRNKPYNNKSDVWALGCVLYEMATFNHAFNGRTMYELMRTICAGKFSLSTVQRNYGDPMASLITKMLNASPSLRLSVNNVLRINYTQQSLRGFVSDFQPQDPIAQAAAAVTQPTHSEQERRGPTPPPPGGDCLPVRNPNKMPIGRLPDAPPQPYKPYQPIQAGPAPNHPTRPSNPDPQRVRGRSNSPPPFNNPINQQAGVRRGVGPAGAAPGGLPVPSQQHHGGASPGGGYKAMNMQEIRDQQNQRERERKEMQAREQAEREKLDRAKREREIAFKQEQQAVNARERERKEAEARAQQAPGKVRNTAAEERKRLEAELDREMEAMLKQQPLPKEVKDPPERQMENALEEVATMKGMVHALLAECEAMGIRIEETPEAKADGKVGGDKGEVFGDDQPLSKSAIFEPDEDDLDALCAAIL